MTWTKTDLDELVRGLLGQSARWQQSIGELGRARSPR